MFDLTFTHPNPINGIISWIISWTISWQIQYRKTVIAGQLIFQVIITLVGFGCVKKKGLRWIFSLKAVSDLNWTNIAEPTMENKCWPANFCCKWDSFLVGNLSQLWKFQTLHAHEIIQHNTTLLLAPLRIFRPSYRHAT